MNWYSVRCIFSDGEGGYEERLTIWQAASFEDATALAEAEAEDYADRMSAMEPAYEYLGFAQAFIMPEPPSHGAEVFSLVRDSDLDPETYLDAFFDTGDERERDLLDD